MKNMMINSNKKPYKLLLLCISAISNSLTSPMQNLLTTSDVLNTNTLSCDNVIKSGEEISERIHEIDIANTP